MSLPWSEKTLKATPVVDDEVMILDSEDTNPDTINKRATLLSLPSSGETNEASNVGTGEEVFKQKTGVTFEFKSLIGETDKIELAGNTNDITFTLGSLVVTTDQANTYDAGLKQSFVGNTSSAGININNAVPSTPVAGDIFRSTNTLQYRGSSATRDIVDLSLTQTLTNKTMTASANTFSGFALGDEVTGASTDLTDSSNIARLDVLNDFTAGTQSQFFQSETGSTPFIGILRLAHADDIVWTNQSNNGDLLLAVDASDFLTFDSSFIAATATQGTSGDVLTSNGGGVAPTFQDAASGVFPVADDVFIIKGSATSSKQLRFEVDGLTDGITRIITPPDDDITLVNTSDGTISNIHVNALAAIEFTKLESLTSANILVGNGSADAASVAMSGDITIDNTGVTSITPGVIVNSDVNASAGIEFTKLESLASANILVGDSNNDAASVAMTGDIVISNLGVTSISTGVIVNADINASADIEFSKLESLTSANILVGNGSNDAASVAMSGDTNIDNAGVVTAQSAIITDKTLKATPVTADQVLISDSEDSNNLKKITISSAVGTVPMGILMANYQEETGGSDNDYWPVTGSTSTGNNASFGLRANLLPVDLTLTRLSVYVSVNGNGANEDVNFQLAISINGGAAAIGNNVAIITGTNTGAFTDVSNSDIIASGDRIAYQSNDDTGLVASIDFDSSSSALRGT